MIIKNALLENGISDIEICNGKIVKLGKIDGNEVIDANGKRVIPGLIDIHIHGFGGKDCSDGDLQCISKKLALAGTTSWLPTTMTDSIENLKTTTSEIPQCQGANILGFHLEGPFLSQKRSGAQNKKYLKNPDINELKAIKNVKLITVAPELDGAIDFIKQADCVVSIGHTDCTYLEAKKAIEAGAMSLTHTFNAMPPLLHREPGPIGAAFEAGIYSEVICDGRHVSRAAVLALYKMMTAEKLILVSDAIRPAGMPDGEYSSGGLTVIVKNGVATLTDGTLAGGSNPLLKCVKTAVEFGIPFYDAIKMATETPAKLLKINKGRITEGYDADLVLLNDDFTVDKTIINGMIFKG